MTYTQAWLGEMWAPVPEFRNGDSVAVELVRQGVWSMGMGPISCENGGTTKDGPGVIAATTASPGLTPDYPEAAMDSALPVRSDLDPDR